MPRWPDARDEEVIDVVARPVTADGVPGGVNPGDPHGSGTAQGTRPARSRVRFMGRHAAHFIALGLGSGLAPVAPGTAGTLWAWASYWALSQWIDTAQWGLLIAASLAVGWWACTVTAEHAGVADPGFIVWDEIVAFWIVLWLVTPAGFLMQLGAFLLFRYFDAAKPGPVRWADQAFKGRGWRGGFGILFDDLVAAGCTLLVIALLQRAWT